MSDRKWLLVAVAPIDDPPPWAAGASEGDGGTPLGMSLEGPYATSNPLPFVEKIGPLVHFRRETTSDESNSNRRKPEELLHAPQRCSRGVSPRSQRCPRADPPYRQMGHPAPHSVPSPCRALDDAHLSRREAVLRVHRTLPGHCILRSPVGELQPDCERTGRASPTCSGRCPRSRGYCTITVVPTATRS